LRGEIHAWTKKGCMAEGFSALDAALELEALESGDRSVRHRSAGAAWVDRTPHEIRRLKKNIADLDTVLNRLKN
jgi:hypothetical protein